VSQLSALMSSSIGRKAVMAVTGLLLIGFLITHVAANLLVLFDQKAFNDYSHALISNPLIYIAELGLLLIFVGHAINGLLVTMRNRTARPVAYEYKQRAGGVSRKTFSSTTMIVSGLVALVFVPLHIRAFKFGPEYESATNPGVRDLARLVLEEFQGPMMVAWYEVALLVLAFHAWHGVASAMDSLGISHRTWLRNACRGLAVVIFAGFLIIPVAIYLGGVS